MTIQFSRPAAAFVTIASINLSTAVLANVVSEQPGHPDPVGTANQVWNQLVVDHHVPHPTDHPVDPHHHVGDPTHAGNPHHTTDPQHHTVPHDHTPDNHHVDPGHPPASDHHPSPHHPTLPPQHHAGDPHSNTSAIHILAVSITTDHAAQRSLHVQQADVSDLTGDGVINRSDVLAFYGSGAFQSGDTTLAADVNYVRFADGKDALILVDTAHFPEDFGIVGTLNALSGNPVPEPSAALIAAACTICLRRNALRRKRFPAF